MQTKECIICGKMIEKKLTTSQYEWDNRTKFCSRNCYYKSKIGIETWNKGIKGSVKPNKTSFKKGQTAWNKGLKGFMAGPRNATWRGDDVRYSGIHMWIKNNWKKPKHCEQCGKKEKIVKRSNMHWHNISGLYERDRNDWMALCASCHKKYHNNM